MPMKTYRPVTPTLRYRLPTSLIRLPLTNLINFMTKPKINGRNNRGVITVRRRGSTSAFTGLISSATNLMFRNCGNN